MSIIRYRINPDRQVPWNDLPLLPIDESLYRTTEILEELGEAKAALGKLQGRSIVIPNQGILINTISLQEAKASSEIENIFTTDDELYKAFSEHQVTTENQGTSKEVLRYREALWSGYHDLKSEKSFSNSYFINVFREIKQTKESIRPSHANTLIKQGGTGPRAGQVLYTPPNGIEVIKGKLKNLNDFINNDDKYKMDHLLKMAIAHFQFEAIHPFRDGNGRTGRIFNIHYLTKKGLLDLPILFLSRYILENKNDYYSGLMGVSQRGDWKTWLLFMLRAVTVTSAITYNKINDIVLARESILNHLKKHAKQIRKPELLTEMLFTQPITKVKHLQQAKLYAEGTARDYLNQLCKMQILEKKTIEGHHYYLNLELYKILAE